MATNGSAPPKRAAEDKKTTPATIDFTRFARVNHVYNAGKLSYFIRLDKTREHRYRMPKPISSQFSKTL